MTAPRGSALVTGGSRGIGAVTCVRLAHAGFDVAFTYRNKAARADQVASAITAAGAAALPLRCDITAGADIARAVEELRSLGSPLRVVVLNASGGLERDLIAADADYPMHINRDAQLAVLDAVAPLLESGATVVFVTSHWAHLYGRVAQLPQYEPVARSKRAGEVALRERAPRSAFGFWWSLATSSRGRSPPSCSSARIRASVRSGRMRSIACRRSATWRTQS